MKKELTDRELELNVKELEKQVLAFERIEDALKESEEKYRLITENSWSGIIILQQGSITYANKRFLKMVGYDSNEIIGEKILIFIHPDDWSKFSVRARRGLRGEYSPPLFDIRLVKKDGEITWVDCNYSSSKFQNRPALIINLVDITDRIRAEVKIKNAYAELNQIFHTAADGMLVIDKTFNVLRANDTFSVLFGIDREYAVGKKCYDVIHGSLCHSTACPLIRILNGEESVQCEVAKERKDGLRISCIVTAIAFRGAKGELIGIIEDFRDISDRVRAEEALRREHDELEKRVAERTRDLTEINRRLSLEIAERNRAEKAYKESEEKYRLITENSWSGIVILHHGVIQYTNPRFCEMVGYKPDEIIGQKALEFIHPDDREAVDIHASRKLKGQDAAPLMELRMFNKKGEITWVDCLFSLGKFQAEPSLVVMLVDRTERKRAENKLLTYQMQLQSLASELSLIEERERRRMAVALHDRIGQALAIAKIKLGFMGQILSSANLAKAIEEIGQLIEQTIQDTRSLTLELSPPILYELGFVQAAEWLTEKIQKQNNIIIEFEDDGQPKHLDHDISFLLFRSVQELLMNVSKHARANHARVSVTRIGDKLRIDVKDNGIGFKTDKIGTSMSKTGGFGLFSIRERLSHYNGKMEIHSEPGKGTQATLIMPIKYDKETVKEKAAWA